LIYIKTKKEIDYIRESCRIVAETLELMRKSVKQGVSSLELDKLAEDFILSKDAYPAFKGYKVGRLKYPSSICVSINEEVVHGLPSKDRIIKNGDVVSIDVGVVKNKYYGDAATTIIVGDVEDRIKKLVEVTEKSLYIGIEQAVSGNKVHDISFAIQDYVESHNFGIVKTLTGHGVGMYLHEEPAIPNYGIKGTGPKMKNNMTLAIEPMITLGTDQVNCLSDGWTVVTEDKLTAAHFEHTVLINGDKPEILTVA